MWEESPHERVRLPYSRDEDLLKVVVKRLDSADGMSVPIPLASEVSLEGLGD